MTSVPALTEALRSGRRVVESLPGVVLLSDFKWFPDARSWGLHCRITIDSPNEDLIPSVTDWWVLLDSSYPFGRIRFFPDKDRGVQVTFAHQLYNGPPRGTALWRTGDICLTTPLAVFGKHGHDPDPIGELGRLSWYFQRALSWLKAAASGTLVADGDPFELPVFVPVGPTIYTIASCESAETFKTWQACAVQWGTAEIVTVGPRQAHTYAVRRFFSPGDDELLAYDWGVTIADSAASPSRAVWMRCGGLPVLSPYQAPLTWGELRLALDRIGGTLDPPLRDTVDLVRDGKPHLLILGFPVSPVVGGPFGQMHWQPMLLPVVSYGIEHAPGFRPNREGYWRRDRSELFRDRDKIDWQISENWHPRETARRGRLTDVLTEQTPLVIGGGAIGGVVSELLLRAGVSKLVLIDDDRLSQANLCRHVLGVSAIGEHKARALAHGFNESLAHVTVRSICEKFPPLGEDDRHAVDACDLILDCTGDDATLYELNQYPWGREHLFCSISLSYGAKRVYVFTSRASQFPIQAFRQELTPWIQQDTPEFDALSLAADGIGCWHPAFPARIDSVWMLAAAAVRRLEEAMIRYEAEPKLVVYEQVQSDDGFHGIQRK